MVGTRIAETSILLNEVCEKLYKRVNPQTAMAYDWMFRDMYGDNVYMKAYALNQIMDAEWDTDIYKENMKNMKKEIQSLKEQLVAKEEEILAQGSLRETIAEQKREIEWFQSLLEVYKPPVKKDRRKNAYKDEVDPVRIYRDIESGMSKTAAAKKYNVSRATIRARYEEGKQRIEGAHKDV